MTGKRPKSDLPDARAALAELRRQGNPARAALCARFFKTGPGEYGAGDRFLGLTVPAVRELAKRFGELPLAQVEILLDDDWHEARQLALLILVRQYQARRATDAERGAIYALYLRRAARVNNWDLVDCSAEHIVGPWLRERSRAPLRKLTRSKLLWERRIAVLATFHYIKNGDPAETLIVARELLQDEHDLIHKAVGWMLREVGKRVDRQVLRDFLDEHAPRMPRTMLRYAIEQLPAEERLRYLAVPSASLPAKKTAASKRGAPSKKSAPRGKRRA